MPAPSELPDNLHTAGGLPKIERLGREQDSAHIRTLATLAEPASASTTTSTIDATQQTPVFERHGAS